MEQVVWFERYWEFRSAGRPTKNLSLCLIAKSIGPLKTMKQLLLFRKMHSDSISFEEVNRDFAENLKMDVTLSDPQWISLYHTHHRYVAQFRKGRCFLAGDAAHVHSPAGAQGMNTGLQDAYNLAWKLAFVIRGRADEKLLDTYHEERLPIARKLVRTTDRLFGITVSQNPLIVFWRVHVMPRLVALIPKEKHLIRFAFRLISQIGIHYRNSSLSRNGSLET